MSQILDEKVFINGLNLHYQTCGTGELVLLLHGFPEDCYAWRHQIPELAKNFKVVALDLPGYGQSDKPNDIEFYDVDRIAGTVAKLIRSFGVDKAHLVGHDWGGVISWRVAQLHPEVLDKLVIMNAPHPVIMSQKLKSSFSQMKKSWYIFFFQIPVLPEKIMTTWTRPIFEKILRGTTVNKNAFTDQDIDHYVEVFQRPGTAQAAIKYYRAAFKRKERPMFKNVISTPTLLIWGENDIALGVELTEGMEPLFNNGFTLKTIPNCSHWVNEEQPDAVNRLLLDFLKK